jgi:hypothetical protein
MSVLVTATPYHLATTLPGARRNARDAGIRVMENLLKMAECGCLSRDCTFCMRFVEKNEETRLHRGPKLQLRALGRLEMLQAER